MKKYHDNNKSYGAIVEAMQQIRYNALAEEYGEDEMEEALMYEAEMEGMSDDEEEAVAQLMDEALYEMDMDDDEDNLNEADDDRKTRRRRRLRQALLIGAGLAAAGLGGAAYVTGRGMRDTAGPAGGPIPNLKSGFGGVLQDIQTGGSSMAQDFGGAVGGAIDAAGRYADDKINQFQAFRAKPRYSSNVSPNPSKQFGNTGDFDYNQTRMDAERERFLRNKLSGTPALRGPAGR